MPIFSGRQRLERLFMGKYCYHCRSLARGLHKQFLAFLLFTSSLTGLSQQVPPAEQIVLPKATPALNRLFQLKGKHPCRILVKDPASFHKWMGKNLPDASFAVFSADSSILTIKGLDAIALRQLLKCSWVTCVDIANRRAKEESELKYNDLGVNKISPVHSLSPGLTGAGLVVSVKERPFDKTDIDFKGRIVGPDRIAAPPSLHATTIATLITGGGNSAPSGKGVAWRASLATSDFKELLPDDGLVLSQAAVSVQNHSYGVDIENYYGIESFEYDRQCVRYPEILHVFSSGNQGNQAAPTGAYQGIGVLPT